MIYIYIPSALNTPSSLCSRDFLQNSRARGFRPLEGGTRAGGMGASLSMGESANTEAQRNRRCFSGLCFSRDLDLNRRNGLRLRVCESLGGLEGRASTSWISGSIEWTLSSLWLGDEAKILGCFCVATDKNFVFLAVYVLRKMQDRSRGSVPHVDACDNGNTTQTRSQDSIVTCARIDVYRTFIRSRPKF